MPPWTNADYDDVLEALRADTELKYDVSPLGTGKNWVTGVGGLPLFIRAIAHALIRNGKTESNAIQIAVGTVQRWARGEGGVSAKTRAKAAAALAEWEAKKVASRAKTAGKDVAKAAGDAGKKDDWTDHRLDAQARLLEGAEDKLFGHQRHVRTPAGAALFHEPIGAPIADVPGHGVPVPKAHYDMQDHLTGDHGFDKVGTPTFRAFVHYATDGQMRREHLRAHGGDLGNEAGGHRHPSEQAAAAAQELHDLAMGPAHTTSAERHAAMGGYTASEGRHAGDQPRRVTRDAPLPAEGDRHAGGHDRVLGTPPSDDELHHHLTAQHGDDSALNSFRGHAHLAARHEDMHGGDVSKAGGTGHRHIGVKAGRHARPSINLGTEGELARFAHTGKHPHEGRLMKDDADDLEGKAAMGPHALEEASCGNCGWKGKTPEDGECPKCGTGFGGGMVEKSEPAPRHVRTPAGTRRYRRPAGSTITAPGELAVDVADRPLELDLPAYERTTDAPQGAEGKGDPDMGLEHKSAAVTDVRVLDPDHGIVETVVSVTGLVDRVKDRILPGAYAKSLAERLPKGVWSHDWSKPVSRTLDAKELLPGDPRLPEKVAKAGGGGLLIKTQFNLDTERGRDAFSDVQFFGDDQEWSIGYKVPPGGAKWRGGVREIKDLDVFEYSPVLFGAMPLAKTVSVKDAQQAWKAAVPFLFPECNESGTCCAACGAKKEAGGLEGKADPEDAAEEMAGGAEAHVELADGRYCLIGDDGETVDCFDTQEEAEAALEDLTDDDMDGKDEDLDDLEGKVWDGGGWIEEKDLDLYTASGGAHQENVGFGSTAGLKEGKTKKAKMHRFAGPKGGDCKICGKTFQAGAHAGSKNPMTEVMSKDYLDAEAAEYKRDIPEDKRKELADKGQALPDHSYPIESREDLKSAIKLAQSGHGDVAAAKKLCKKMAKKLDAEDLLPDDWKDDSGAKSAVSVTLAGIEVKVEVTGDFEVPADELYAVLDRSARELVATVSAPGRKAEGGAEGGPVVALTEDELEAFDLLRLR